MLRGMMLVLVLLLITLSAAYLGRDEQFTEVLRLAKTPKPSSSQTISSSDAPSEIPDEEPSGEPSPVPSEDASDAPRFVLDAPMPQEAQLLDPSARHLISSDDSMEGSSMAPHIPDQQETEQAAEPYVKELYALKERMSERLAALERQIMAAFLVLPQEDRAAALERLFESYYPQMTALEQQADEEAELILNRMAAALASINADNTLVEAAREAYLAEKAEKIAYYMQMLSKLQGDPAPSAVSDPQVSAVVPQEE